MGPNTAASLVERTRTTGPLVVGAVVSLAAFLFAVQLLGTATEAAQRPLERLFLQYVSGDGRALGLGWLATYGLTNGSVVAALAVSLFDNGILTGSQLFLMVAGSRLGGAAIVVLIGGLDYLQKRRYSLGEATSLGVLTFVVTYTVYLPATALGYGLLGWLRGPFERVANRFALSFEPLDAVEAATRAVVDATGAGFGVVLALALLFAGLNLFDRVLKRVDTEWLRRQFFRRFQGKWVAFGLGVLLTSLTTSVAFSLGVIVPLYNREYLKRREVVPYVLGANIGTLFDTVAVGVILESPPGVALVLALLGIATVLTLLALVLYDAYFEFVDGTQDVLVDDRRYLAAFLVSLVVVPVGVTLLPV